MRFPQSPFRSHMWQRVHLDVAVVTVVEVVAVVAVVGVSIGIGVAVGIVVGAVEAEAVAAEE